MLWSELPARWVQDSRDYTMENLIKNKVKMKTSTVWKVSKVHSTVPDTEKVLHPWEQLLLLSSVYTPYLHSGWRSGFPHSHLEKMPFWLWVMTTAKLQGFSPSFKKHFGGATVYGKLLAQVFLTVSFRTTMCTGAHTNHFLLLSSECWRGKMTAQVRQ